MTYITRKQEEAGRATNRTLRGHLRYAGPINCIMDSSKEPAHEQLRLSYSQIPPAGLQAPPVLCVPHPHTARSCDLLTAHAPHGGGKSKLWQTARQHAQKVGPNLRARKGPKT